MCAAIAVEPVIAAIIEAIGISVEKGTEAAVVASISSGVSAAVVEAVTAVIAAAITSGLASKITGEITKSTTQAIEDSLRKSLKQEIKDVISSQGVHNISEAITAIPSEEAVNMLSKAAIDAINPHLWVFQDPSFFRLTKLIKALRAVKQGKKPEDDDEDDDDCDEEKCRYFHGPEAADDGDDFIFFTVFGSDECKEGDEVFSMSSQWKKLKSLVDDPIGGHYVSQLFRELFDSSADIEEEEDDLEDGVRRLALVSGVTKKIKKPVKIAYGKMVYFGNKTIYNVHGSSVDKRKSNWLKAYLYSGYGKCDKCYIASEDPPCDHNQPLKGNIVGGHMWSPALKKADASAFYYILPICRRHNKSKVYDKPKPDNTGWLKCTSDAWAMKITSVSKVPGWKGKYQALSGSTVFLLLTTNVDSKAEECHEITQPKPLMDWLVKEVHQIALEFAKGPIEIVIKEVSATVLKKLQEIIKQAGTDAIKWTKSEGHNIMLQSLIPIYGLIQAITRLNSLKSDAIGRFHSGAQTAIAKYKDECLGGAEQARRKQRLSEETNKVIASKKWKDRIVAFEGTVASKVSTLVKP